MVSVVGAGSCCSFALSRSHDARRIIYGLPPLPPTSRCCIFATGSLLLPLFLAVIVAAAVDVDVDIDVAVAAGVAAAVAVAEVICVQVARCSLLVARWSLVVGRWSMVEGRWSFVDCS